MMTSPSPEAGHPTGPPSRPNGILLLDQPFEERDLPALRRAVSAHADRTALPVGRVKDLVLIVSELASNAIRHGGGAGRLRLWLSTDSVCCRVTDDGPGLPLPRPVPQQRPEPGAHGGRGLWLVLNYADTLILDDRASGGASITATLRLPPPS